MRDIYKLELIQDEDKAYYRLTIDEELVICGYSVQELFDFIAYAYDEFYHFDPYCNAIERFRFDIDDFAIKRFSFNDKLSDIKDKNTTICSDDELPF